MTRLYTRIYLHFLGVLVVVGLAMSLVFTTGWRAQFLHASVERLARHAAALVADRFDDPASRAAAVRRLADELEVDVTVRATDGRVLTAAGNDLPTLTAEEIRALVAPEIVKHDHLWFAAAPIRVRGGVVGVLEATPRHRFQPSPMRPILMGALALFIVGVATAPLAGRISRPVERLTEATRRFGGGDLSYRVELARRGRGRHRHRRHDEIAELTRAWNDMADRVEQLVRGQKELLANVSHELRSPLARMRMALELVPRDEAVAARLRDIETDVSELDRLIEDVLTMSRLEATGLPVHLDRVDVAALLAQVAERASRDPFVAGREVRVAEAPACTLGADGALLRRALWNVVENAAKYGAPPIALSARVAGDRLELTVTDEGPGIPAADRERVFQPFYRADKAHTPGGGFGLGLALASRVAEVHGGSIRAEAARAEAGVERGLRVTIAIPLGAA
jgi:signal transduction histidine kinase